MESGSKKLLLSAVIAGIATGASMQILPQAQAADNSAQYHCEGGNLCKSQSACAGKANSCSGMNSCQGKGWVYTKDKAACDEQLAKVKAKTKSSPKKKARAHGSKA